MVKTICPPYIDGNSHCVVVFNINCFETTRKQTGRIQVYYDPIGQDLWARRFLPSFDPARFAVHVDTEDMAQLAGDDQHGRGRHEGIDDGPAEEVGHAAQTENAEQKQEDAGEHRQGAGADHRTGGHKRILAKGGTTDNGRVSTNGRSLFHQCLQKL